MQRPGRRVRSRGANIKKDDGRIGDDRAAGQADKGGGFFR